MNRSRASAFQHSMEESLDMAVDLHRILFLEQALKIAEANYAKDPSDADNLTRWGGALLELSHFQNGQDSKKMIEDAISKLEEALVINPKKHDALWCLGNGLTNLALMTPNLNEAMGYVDKASSCYLNASHEDPGNETYIRSLELLTQVPEMNKDIDTNAFDQQFIGGTSSEAKSSNKKSSDLRYHILGCIIFAVAIVAWVGMRKSGGLPRLPR